MPSQRLLIAALAGNSAVAATRLIEACRNDPASAAIVDCFCESLRANATAMYVVYYSEWIDRWLMGQQIFGLRPIAGRRFELLKLTRAEALERASRCGDQHQEQAWLADRLREATSAWEELVHPVLIVVVREVFGSLATDDEILAAMEVVPDWLSSD